MRLKIACSMMDAPIRGVGVCVPGGDRPKQPSGRRLQDELGGLGLGWFALDRWLHGFAQRISLSPWLFLAAGGAAFVVAALTVSGHALRVASAKPVGALRYE